MDKALDVTSRSPTS